MIILNAMPKSQKATPKITEAIFQVLERPPSLEDRRIQHYPQSQEIHATTTYFNLPQLLNEQGEMRTYFTSSSFLVMTDPTDEKAADAFCPA